MIYGHPCHHATLAAQLQKLPVIALLPVDRSTECEIRSKSRDDKVERARESRKQGSPRVVFRGGAGDQNPYQPITSRSEEQSPFDLALPISGKPLHGIH